MAMEALRLRGRDGPVAGCAAARAGSRKPAVPATPLCWLNVRYV
jgi:hypothetical protein